MRKVSKGIWNYKEERGFENRKSYILKPFRALIFSKKILNIMVLNTI